MESLNTIGEKAVTAFRATAKISTADKNFILNASADILSQNAEYILEQNIIDVAAAEANGIKASFIDRLRLTPERIESIAIGMRQVAGLQDPIGEVLSMKLLENGLQVGQKRVPLGVIGIIYESRPNVTADSYALCLKSGNSVILRGGKEALRSNMAIVNIFRKVLNKNGFDENTVQLITDTSRETAFEFMKLRKYVDVLIPRGGAGLIANVVENSTIPVIETGTGNCHIFVDESADFKMATDIIVNAKTQRPSVCNACEKALVHKNIANEFLPMICAELRKKNVEIRSDEAVAKIVCDTNPATTEDWHTEYTDLIICIGVVSGIDEAISHIQKYSTRHSEAIITESYANSQKFLNEIDSAAVYVNASTRFTDGFELGFGAEIGISTQKLHARGPLGLKELTSTKYIVYGNGQIRN